MTMSGGEAVEPAVLFAGLVVPAAAILKLASP
jgi:hypothetical protein